AVVDPRAALFDDLLLDAEIDEVAFAADAALVHQIELGLLERGGHFVLDDLGANARADRLFALFHVGDLADFDADAAVELEGQAARRRFWIAEHDADLLANLVDED